MTDPAMLIVIFLCLGWAFVVVQHFSRSLQQKENPRVVLRRCRASLWAIRKELESLPASKEVHELYAACDKTETTINQVEAGL